MKGYTLKTVFCLSLFIFFVLPFANPVMAKKKTMQYLQPLEVRTLGRYKKP
jgi:hypothetical protein